MQPTYKYDEWKEHEKQISAYKYNIATPHYVEVDNYIPGSVENRRYSKGIEDGSRRALTSQPGKRSRKSRLNSGSVKAKYSRKSKDELDDNPYTSGLEHNTQNPVTEDDDETNLININTQNYLNKTDTGKVCG